MTESKVIEIIRKYLKLVPVCGDDEALDMTLKALTQYQLLEKHLTDIFGPEFSIETVVEEPVNAKILTYEDAADWDAYRAIGTPKECRAAMDKQEPFKPETTRLTIGIGRCKCGVEFLDSKTNYCGNCGQKLNWSTETVTEQEDTEARK